MTNLTQHWRSLFENKYLGAWNLWSSKRKAYVTATVVIESIAQESVTMQGGRKSLETLIRFKDKRTPLIATKKMARVLVAMFGPAPEDAIGKTITLYVERGFKTKDGPADVLRIRNDRAGQNMKDSMRDAQTPEPDEIPAPPEAFDGEVNDAPPE